MRERKRLEALASFTEAYNKEQELKKALAESKEARKDAKRKINEKMDGSEADDDSTKYVLSKKFAKLKDSICSYALKL